ncbi:MAG: metallopeptidase TldD-related protein [Bacteroidota bacterium]|nr:metallopeptidase TldD-related protein [Chlorobiota bacterium]MDW8271544.1 metallopeptidase TldD-related protein [Bacteroidota bacterium]
MMLQASTIQQHAASVLCRCIACAALLLSAETRATASSLDSTDTVVRALHTELQRWQTAFGAVNPTPYFVAYWVYDVQNIMLSAEGGAIETAATERRRLLDVSVRVGSYQLDNTHILRGSSGIQFGRGQVSFEMPFDGDEDALRQVIWQATDRAYKAAVERYEKVLTNRAVKVREEDTSADFTPYPPQRYYEPPQQLQCDTAHWSAQLRALSSELAASSAVLHSQISLAVQLLRKYLVTSEGTTIVTNEPLWRLAIVVRAKAEDGMTLPLYRTYLARAEQGLPSYDSLLRDVRAVVELLAQLRHAPVLDSYAGPAILSGRAAGVFFHEIFGHRVEGHRIKDPTSSQTLKPFVGKQLFPPFLDVVFDPTLHHYAGVELAGSYRFDDEGVPAQRVVSVQQGVFRNFLMSRSPIEGFPQSNGHGRKQAGAMPVARQSNLIVVAHQTVPLDSLKAYLRAECRRTGKPYGLYFDDIAGGFTFTSRTIPNAFTVQPLVVYKVFADGSPDELVRGVDFIGTPLATFSNIVAASKEIGVFNGICGAESGNVPVSACSPALLVSTLEVQKKAKSQSKPPLLPPPPSTVEEVSP